VRALVVASLALAVVAGSACENCSCVTYGNYASVMLTDKDASRLVPVGMFQTVGVVLPGSGRAITVSDTGRLVAHPVPPQLQPDGMTMELFVPDAPGEVGTPYEFGGTVTISAPASGDHPQWTATLVIGTDPRGDAGGGPFVGGGAFVGSGTTVMALGQGFVVSWADGGATPTSSVPSVLRPFGAPELVHNGYQLIGKTAVTSGHTYWQQLYVGVGVGSATLTLSRAVHTLDDNLGSFGGTQRIVVHSVPGFTCSPEHGCVQTAALSGPTSPDHYYPAGATPSA
jgi:hypothetical protein